MSQPPRPPLCSCPPSHLPQTPLADRKCDPSTAQPKVHATLPSACIVTNTSPSNNKWLSVSRLAPSLWRQRQGVRSPAQAPALPERPHNKQAAPHRAEWHLFLQPLEVGVPWTLSFCVWSRLCTACGERATGGHTESAAGDSLACLLRDK